MSSVIVNLAPGATEAQIQSALNSLQDGGTLVLAANQTISIKSGLLMDVSSRSITLDLNGSTLQQAGDVSVLTVRGAHAPGQGATIGKNAAGEVTVTTASGAPNAAVGDWIKVYSDSLLANDHGSETRLGQAMQVVKVEGNTVTLKGELIDAADYVDNVRISKYVGGTPTVENGTIRGDQANAGWVKDLVQVRSTVDADLNHLTVRDGNSMGINVVDSVNATVSQGVVINLRDNPTAGQNGYAVHSASSYGTTVDGLYVEKVRHATDDNAVGTAAGTKDPSRYGADLAMTVSNVVANGTSAAAFSWHTEGRYCTITDSVVFNSYGVLGARGLHNSMSDVAGSGNARGIQFYEYGDGDGRYITVDNVQLRGTTYYAYTSTGSTADNVVANSSFEVMDKKAWIANGISTVDSSTRVLTQAQADAAVTLAGTALNDRLLGGKGADTISGGDGSDYIWGGAGADLLTGGAGADRFAYLSTAEGGDVIADFRAGLGGDAIDLSVIAIQNGWRGDLFAKGYVSLVQSGADTLVKVDANGGGNDYVTLATLKNVSATAARANISTDIVVTDVPAAAPEAAAPPPNSLAKVEAAPALILPAVDLKPMTVNGGAGGDLLFGGAGDDKLVGNDGDDTLVGGAGRDVLMGGNGSNMASYRNAASGLTVDLQTPSANSGDAAGDSYSMIAKVEGSGFADKLYGNGGANTIYGQDGGDLIEGRGGADWLYGGDGNDTISGGTESDKLFGDAGDDRLHGGNGYDVMTGGAGNDEFVFEFGTTGWDTVTDFAQGDHIVLAHFGLSALDAGNFVANGTPKAVAAVGTVLYDTDDGSLFWDADGTGKGAAVKIGLISDHPALTAGDFLFA